MRKKTIVFLSIFCFVFMLCEIISQKVQAQESKNVLYDKLENFKKLSLDELSEDSITYSDSSFSFIAHGEKMQIFISKSNSVIKWRDLKFELTYGILGKIYLQNVYKFDLDANGFDDILIASWPVGASGKAASITKIALLFFSEKEISLYEVSSFSSVKESFYDLNTDNRFEYLCLLNDRIDSESGWVDFFVANFFSFNMDSVYNITSDLDFKTIYVFKNGRMFKDKIILERLEHLKIFKNPSVFDPF